MPMRIHPAQHGKPAPARARSAPRTHTLERALAALASDQHGTVGRAQLLALGFFPQEIDSRIAAGRLIPIFSGTYAVGHLAITRESRWMAATLAAGPASALSYRDAAALWAVGDFTFGGYVEAPCPVRARGASVGLGSIAHAIWTPRTSLGTTASRSRP